MNKKTSYIYSILLFLMFGAGSALGEEYTVALYGKDGSYYKGYAVSIWSFNTGTLEEAEKEAEEARKREMRQAEEMAEAEMAEAEMAEAEMAEAEMAEKIEARAKEEFRKHLIEKDIISQEDYLINKKHISHGCRDVYEKKKNHIFRSYENAKETFLNEGEYIVYIISTNRLLDVDSFKLNKESPMFPYVKM